MKFVGILAIFVAVFCVADAQWRERVPGTKRSVGVFAVYQEWGRFKELYRKSYKNIEEEGQRFQIFLQNLDNIEQHNTEFAEGKQSFHVKMNEFGDMTQSEFVQTMNGYKKGGYGDNLSRSDASLYMEPHNTVLPKQVDWRDHDRSYVTPVKNQGACGSCWAFSATGALEGQHMRKTGKLVSLSEQNLVDCSGKEGNHGCGGGIMEKAYQYVKDNDGIDTEQSYPYEAKNGKCRYTVANRGANDTGFVDIASGDEQKLQSAVATVGPIAVAIDASHSSFRFYHGGVYIEPKCTPTDYDHGVLVVGYGVTDDGVDYWIVKNSWGSGWGEKGYIKMARNRDNQCGIATKASYPLV